MSICNNDSYFLVSVTTFFFYLFVFSLSLFNSSLSISQPEIISSNSALVFGSAFFVTSGMITTSEKSILNLAKRVAIWICCLSNWSLLLAKENTLSLQVLNCFLKNKLTNQIRFYIEMNLHHVNLYTYRVAEANFSLRIFKILSLYWGYWDMKYGYGTEILRPLRIG